jgi:hypothetical protein
MFNRLLEMARGADRNEILAVLEETHHPVMTLYARLERRLPLQKTHPRPGL